MPDRTELKHLSHDQKDDLILKLQSQVVELQSALETLQARLNLNSTNSSKPPSSDGLKKHPKKKPKSLREASGRKPGGQAGHVGKTLQQVEHADTTIRYEVPEKCSACQSTLPEAKVGEIRQVFDLPITKFEVTAHHAMQATCQCGKVHKGVFPDNVTASVQYGPRVEAACVYLHHQQHVPLKRTTEILEEMHGLPISEATVLRACADAAQRMQPTVDAIGQAFLTKPTVHADETGIRVTKQLHWLHILATDTLTWMARHRKRGGEAFADLGILIHYLGVLLHDGWKPYRALQCLHALCNAHHLRELTYLYEELKQQWAGDMMELLRHANHIDNGNKASDIEIDYADPQYQQMVGDLRSLYDAILDDGEAMFPRVEASGKQGGTKQSLAFNLINRLREYADDVWRFMEQPDVPFTNNLAEQAVRMPKVKQKISGGFRTTSGADRFCTIRSYLATMQKQGADIFDCLVKTFSGNVPQPNLA